jgi:hypothetical protein
MSGLGCIIVLQAKGKKMARRKTGVSKKSNRLNLEALALAQSWKVGVKCEPKFAYEVSGGKFGNELNTGDLVNTFAVALWLVKNSK